VAIADFLQDMSGQRLLQLAIVCEFLLQRERGHCATAANAQQGVQTFSESAAVI
jgi:hypothetical protein